VLSQKKLIVVPFSGAKKTTFTSNFLRIKGFCRDSFVPVVNIWTCIVLMKDSGGQRVLV